MKYIGSAVVFVVALTVLTLIMAIPTFYLWNWLFPTIFAVKEITLLQAWGINWLAAILFQTPNFNTKS